MRRWCSFSALSLLALMPALAQAQAYPTKPIRWVVNTTTDVEHTGGNTAISQAGQTVNGNPAAIIAHENALTRMSAENRAATDLPLNTFFEEGRDFNFNGEAVFLYHVPPAHTDGDLMVYFRGSDVLVAGDLFTTTTYPVLRADSGGGIDGYIAGLNKLLDVAVPKYLQEGGTYIIPGHGRIGDEAEGLQRPPEMRRRRRLHVDRAALGMGDAEAPGMEVELLGDAFGHQRRVDLGLAHLDDVDDDFAVGELGDRLADLVDVRALLADDDARARGVDRDARLLRRALDDDARHAGLLQASLEVRADVQVLVQDVRVLLAGGVPARIPRAVDTDAQPDRVDLLTH